MDALAEDVTYVDPLAKEFLYGREAVREHFKRINPGGATGIVRQEFYADWRKLCKRWAYLQDASSPTNDTGTKGQYRHKDKNIGCLSPKNTQTKQRNIKTITQPSSLLVSKSLPV